VTIRKSFGSTLASIVIASCVTSRCLCAVPAGGTVARFAADGAWCWFQDPRAVYVDGERTRTYACWVTSHGGLQIGAFDHRTATIEYHTVKEDWGIDDHNTGSILVLPDRRLMVFYARHNESGLFCRRTSHPEDIGSWDDEAQVSAMPRVTYSHPVYLADEQRYYVFWRGESWKPTFATSSDGVTWSEAHILVQEPGREGRDIRPYLKVTSDGKHSIHLAFTDGHPRDEAENSVYYVRYTNGAFYRANGSVAGTLAGLPLRQSVCDRVYDAGRTHVRAWVWDIALDEAGRPAIAYTRLPSDTSHRYHVARWDGARWDDGEVATGGRWFPQTPPGVREFESHYSGGITLRPGRPDIAYLSRQSGEEFVIEKWSRTPGDTCWTRAAVLSPRGARCVRPVIPAGYAGESDHLLWMNGDYIHYTHFHTRIEMYLQPK
jgi:hypothetical protein